MAKLYYLQAPTFSINAESATAPRLGSIFYSLNRLSGSLNQLERISVSSELINNTAIAGFNDSTTKGFMAVAGLNANLLQGIAGSADIIYGLSKGKKETHFCELLETVEFEPTSEFVTKSIAASSNVRSTLRNALPGRKRVYMITGLKVATGLTTSTSTTTHHGPVLRVGVDAMAFGIPASAGPEVELATSRVRTVTQGRSSDKIIFAYRVVRIKQGRDGEATWKYKSGGRYSVDDDDSEDEEETWEIEPLQEESVAEDYPDSVRMEVE